MNIKSSKNRFYFITLIMAFIVVAFWFQLPSQDHHAYFNFADTRSFAGIPNFGDVLSNLAFVIVGLMGLHWIIKRKSFPKALRQIGSILALATVLVGFGSAYFHWTPNPETLFWDRMPMTIGFSAILAFVIAERVEARWGQIAALILIPLGLFTTIGYKYEWLSLRPYLILQFGSLIFILLVVVLIPSRTVPTKYYIMGLAMYALAKVTESYDLTLYEFSNGVISGHSWKHLLAALAILQILNHFRTQPAFESKFEHDL